MIKQDTRKSLRVTGTTLLVNRSLYGWDDSGNKTTHLVGGDLLMVTGRQHGCRVEIINVVNGASLWVWRNWLVDSTSLAFDARLLAQPVDD